MPNPATAAWKEEVNRRVAAHRSRKSGPSSGQEAASEAHSTSNSRAAEALARVSARYANAPSYSQVLAEEARAAVRAAEAASRAAQKAHAVAQSVLAGIEAQVASDPLRAVEPARVEPAKAERPQLVERKPAAMPPAEQPVQIAASQQQPAAELPLPLAAETPALAAPVSEPLTHLIEPPVQDDPEPVVAPPPVLYDPSVLAIRWEPALPEHHQEQAATPEPDIFAEAVQDWSEVREALENDNIGMVEPAQPIHANLIEFPRELVATRRVRPRLVEGPLAGEPEDAQMSIFEVDPASVASEVAEACLPTLETSDSAWPAIRLDEEPEDEMLMEPTPRAELRPIEAAPADWRMMSSVVNFSLVLGATLAASLAAASHTSLMPSLRMVEAGSAIAFVVFALLYCTLFSVLVGDTPGMRYAHLRLVTFEGDRPSVARRVARLAAMLLSVAPAGLGLVWMIFDEDHLCWHDRLTRTYLRRY